MDSYLIALIAVCSVLSIFILCFIVVLLYSCCFTCYSRCLQNIGFRRKKENYQKTVLITGGSSGIGFSLLKLFAQDEYNIINISDVGEDLESSKESLLKINEKINVKNILLDLSNLEKVFSMFKEFEEQNINIDVLVINAAFGKLGNFEKQDIRQMVDVVNCNSISGTILLRYFLEKFIQKGEGKVLITGSITAYVPAPLLSVYAATKAYSRHLARAVNREMKRFPKIHSGTTKTKWFDRAIEKGKVARYQKLGQQSSDEVAFEGYRGLMTGKSEVYPGCFNWFLMNFFYKIAPVSLFLNGQYYFNQLSDV